MEGVLENLQTGETFVSKFRTPPYVFDTAKNKFIKLVEPSVLPLDDIIELNREYHEELEESPECLEVVPPPIILDEACACYAEYMRPNFTVATPELTDCFKLEMVANSEKIMSEKTRILVPVRFVSECDTQFEVKELFLEALEEHGMPYGDWEEIPKDDLGRCDLDPAKYAIRRPKDNFVRPCIEPIASHLVKLYTKV